jgi:general stress protein 26
MFDETIRTFLDKPLLARMSTIDADGYPHTVPVWFMRDGDQIVVISIRGTRKVGHIAANPKGSIMIGGDLTDGGGYSMQGEFLIAPDPDLYWMKTLTYRYESGNAAERDIEAWGKLDMIILRFTPKVVRKV